MSWFYVVLGVVGFLAIIFVEEMAKDYLLKNGNKLSKPTQFLIALIGAGVISVIIYYIRHF